MMMTGTRAMTITLIILMMTDTMVVTLMLMLMLYMVLMMIMLLMMMTPLVLGHLRTLAPYINGGGVVGGAEDQLGRPVVAAADVRHVRLALHQELGATCNATRHIYQ
jgi:hypothetical protein